MIDIVNIKKSGRNVNRILHRYSKEFLSTVFNMDINIKYDNIYLYIAEQIENNKSLIFSEECDYKKLIDELYDKYKGEHKIIEISKIEKDDFNIKSFAFFCEYIFMIDLDVDYKMKLAKILYDLFKKIEPEDKEKLKIWENKLSEFKVFIYRLSEGSLYLYPNVEFIKLDENKNEVDLIEILTESNKIILNMYECTNSKTAGKMVGDLAKLLNLKNRCKYKNIEIKFIYCGKKDESIDFLKKNYFDELKEKFSNTNI